MTNILIAADIFGHTPALDRLAKRLAKRLNPDTLEIMDPYDGTTRFRDEAAAYNFFKTRVGLEAYSKKIADRLKTGNQNRTLIGFSVGAAAIWHLSCDPIFTGVRGAVGFYGSQIRYHQAIRPLFDIKLFWPESEHHFDVDRLILNLRETPRVSCHKTKGSHGFMNERSQNFDPSLYEQYLAQLK